MSIKIFAILTLSLLTAGIFSQSVFNENKLPSEDLKLKEHTLNTFSVENNKFSTNKFLTYPFQQKLDLINSIPSSENKFRVAEDNLVPKKKKSVGLGILLSALLPGAGEFYGENYLKAAIFVGIEALAWGTYIYFNNKGNNQEESYQQYADKYWDVRTYAAWLKNEGFPESSGINPSETDLNVLREQIMVCERANFSHTMPEYKSQQYYELIGKYQNFQAGWTNLEHIPTRDPGPYNYQTYRDPIFLNYADERQKANDFFDYAKIGPITAIVNHILSAADAAWVISTYNSNIKIETGFRIQNRISPYTFEVKQIPTLNIAVNF